MARTRGRSEKIRQFIIARVEKHPNDIAQRVARRFAFSRQAANLHLKRLVDDGVLAAAGATRNRRYHLRILREWDKIYELTASLTEDDVWMRDVSPHLVRLPENVIDIWHYGFTEMFNNAIDHSGGDKIYVRFEENAAVVKITVGDNGAGIFKKIQAALGLLDERHAVLELTKGKFTTDPENHTGEGIFFTSRMFDEFYIVSGEVVFSHEYNDEHDWIVETEKPVSGTAVIMELNKQVARTTREIFNEFTSGDDFAFTKTIVPVRLVQYGDDKLVSRSQAKRLLMRIDRFSTVVLDFAGVESIGQAFADEIFRVFVRRHPEIKFYDIKANAEVGRMIRRVRSAD